MSKSVPTPPRGLAEIIGTFGDPSEQLTVAGEPTPAWRRRQLVYVAVPFAVPLAWDPSRSVTRIRCHRLLQPCLRSILSELHQRDRHSLIKSYGGCYCFRRKQGGAELSTHAWGIAIDLNVAENQPRTAGRMPAQLVELFEDHGFEWGGRWPATRCDPMHFQYCRDY